MKITLKNIKKINSLEFTLPRAGVYLLTGLNGVGKTSLLAALYRIGSSHAFQKYYKTNVFEERLDSYDNAQVIYEINGKEVAYRYGGMRWRATPNKESKLLLEFPYPSVKFIEVNASRVEPYPNEIKNKRGRSVDDSIKYFMCYVLNDRKWLDLKYVNTQRGTGNRAYLLPYKKSNVTYYYSEKNFSLGELCVLRLACKMSDVVDNSLMLIDEVEMALHPQAQVRLLEKVQEISEEKNLTVLFSTHSATLVKAIDRKSIIYLDATAPGHFKSIHDVYPARVLGEIAFDDEQSVDYIFFVEDSQAKMLLEQMLGYYYSLKDSSDVFLPLYKVVPIGGFVQVLEMLGRSSQIFPSHVKQYAFLDKDVKDESLPAARRNNDVKLISLFNDLVSNTRYLPCTPEQGLVDMLEQDQPEMIESVKSLFSGTTIHIDRITKEDQYTILAKENLRARAKDRLNYIVSAIASKSGLDTVSTHKSLYKLYCNRYYQHGLSEIHQLFGTIFRG